jgi:hypothetical protein
MINFLDSTITGLSRLTHGGEGGMMSKATEECSSSSCSSPPDPGGLQPAGLPAQVAAKATPTGQDNR